VVRVACQHGEAGSDSQRLKSRLNLARRVAGLSLGWSASRFSARQSHLRVGGGAGPNSVTAIVSDVEECDDLG
jgi:hypothetical protein